MGAMSPAHWLIVIGVVVLLFGAGRLPDAARSLGRSARILKVELTGMEKPAEPAEPASPLPSSTQEPEPIRQPEPAPKQESAPPAPRPDGAAPNRADQR